MADIQTNPLKNPVTLTPNGSADLVDEMKVPDPNNKIQDDLSKINSVSNSSETSVNTIENDLEKLCNGKKSPTHINDHLTCDDELKNDNLKKSNGENETKDCNTSSVISPGVQDNLEENEKSNLSEKGLELSNSENSTISACDKTDNNADIKITNSLLKDKECLDSTASDAIDSKKVISSVDIEKPSDLTCDLESEFTSSVTIVACSERKLKEGTENNISDNTKDSVQSNDSNLESIKISEDTKNNILDNKNIEVKKEETESVKSVDIVVPNCVETITNEQSCISSSIMIESSSKNNIEIVALDDSIKNKQIVSECIDVEMKEHNASNSTSETDVEMKESNGETEILKSADVLDMDTVERKSEEATDMETNEFSADSGIGSDEKDDEKMKYQTSTTEGDDPKDNELVIDADAFTKITEDSKETTFESKLSACVDKESCDKKNLDTSHEFDTKCSEVTGEKSKFEAADSSKSPSNSGSLEKDLSSLRSHKDNIQEENKTDSKDFDCHTLEKGPSSFSSPKDNIQEDNRTDSKDFDCGSLEKDPSSLSSHKDNIQEDNKTDSKDFDCESLEKNPSLNGDSTIKEQSSKNQEYRELNPLTGEMDVVPPPPDSPTPAVETDMNVFSEGKDKLKNVDSNICSLNESSNKENENSNNKESDFIKIRKDKDENYESDKTQTKSNNSDSNKKRSMPSENGVIDSKRAKVSNPEKSSKENSDLVISSQELEMDDKDNDDVVIEKIERKHPAAVQGLCLPTEILQGFIRGCVRNFLNRRKQETLERLSQQMKSQQSATTYWMETAKHLEKSSEDVKNMKEEVLKKSAQLKKGLSGRSIGVQVTSNVPMTEFSPQPSQDSKKLNESMTRSLPPSVLLNPPAGFNTAPASSVKTPPTMTPRPRPQTSHRGRGRPPSRPFVNNTPHQTPKPPPPVQSGRLSTSPNTPKSNANCIDLTDEEDNHRTNQSPRLNNQNHTMSNKSINGLSNQLNSKSANSSLLLNMANNQMLQQSTNLSSSTSTPASVSQIQLVVPSSQGNTGTMIPVTLVPRQANSGLQNNISVPGIPANSNTSPSIKSSTLSLPPSVHINVNQHPAPAPAPPPVSNVPSFAKRMPPKPSLKISRVSQGIVLSWNMPPLDDHETISSYQLFAYQETNSVIPSTSLWKKVGDVKALPLPMACTLTQFQDGNKYYFTVRAVDQYGRCGTYSDASEIFLNKN